MRFAFYLEDMGHPFSLQQIKKGNLGVGGGMARFRLLFWLAKKGHHVIILNHYDDDVVGGVNAIRIDSISDIPDVIDRCGGVDAFVFNNQPDAQALAFLPIPSAKTKVMWAGNPIPAQWLLWLDNRLLNRIVCVSNNHREAYRHYPNFRRIEVTYSGIDIDLLDESPPLNRRENLVVFLGAPRKTKGFHNLLQAWPYVFKARPDAKLRVLGSAVLHDTKASVGWTGVLDKDLESTYLDPILGSDRNLNKLGIEFAGLLPAKDVFRELKQASIAVVNCNWDGSAETYCRSALEAQACGTPVVGAARGSLPEVIRHNETGLLVGNPNPMELASAIIKLLDEHGLRNRFGEEGQKWAYATANYETLASDWVGIAKRAIEDVPAPSERFVKGDVLRMLGYGRARIYASALLRGKQALL